MISSGPFSSCGFSSWQSQMAEQRKMAQQCTKTVAPPRKKLDTVSSVVFQRVTFISLQIRNKFITTTSATLQELNPSLAINPCGQQLLIGFLTLVHCNYLGIYISQNIRLYKGDFEGQFQTSLQARIMYTYFPSIFCKSCQIHCFLHTIAAISKRLICLSNIFLSNCNSNMSIHDLISNLYLQERPRIQVVTGNSMKMTRIFVTLWVLA